jgi:ABC-type antimicrobial peptide transport system permease subunit
MFLNAFKALSSNRLKTFLIFSSFTFSISAIFLISSISFGIIGMYSNMLKTDGDILVTQAKISDTFFSNVDIKLIKPIEEIEGVTKVSAMIMGASPVEKLPIVAVYGTSGNRFSNYRLTKGKYPEQGEAIVGKSIYQQLSNKKNINIGDRVFKLSGVYSSKIGFENGGVVMNIKDAGSLFHKSSSLLLVNMERGLNPEKIIKTINALSDKIEAESTDDFINNYNQFNIIEKSSNVISFLAFAMGLLAITSIMSITVNERKDEFGIMRALGIGSFKITASLVTESLILALISFAVAFIICQGVLTAIEHSSTLQGYVNGKITLNLAASIFITSVLMSILGVLIPSYTASKIDPIILIQKGTR